MTRDQFSLPLTRFSDREAALPRTATRFHQERIRACYVTRGGCICINNFFVGFTYISRALKASRVRVRDYLPPGIARARTQRMRSSRRKDYSGGSFRKKARAVCLPSSCNAQLR
jgi:hypothetical protein